MTFVSLVIVIVISDTHC